MRWPASARRRLPRGARSSTPNRSNLIVWWQPFGGYWMAASEPLVSKGYTGQRASADATQQSAPEAPVVKTRRRLFTKYVQTPDLKDAAPSPVLNILLRAEYRAALIVPLLGPEGLI